MNEQFVAEASDNVPHDFEVFQKPHRPIRQRAGTYGGYTAAESTKIKNNLNKSENDLKEEKIGIEKLLKEKRKFSRQNRWGNCSYKDLIIHAISSSPNQKMMLTEIYDWIISKVPHFSNDRDTNSSVGWKNSIRHNLSLHNVFVKEHQSGTKSIGAYWKLDLSRQKAMGRRRASTMDPELRQSAQKRKSAKMGKKRENREKQSSPYSIDMPARPASTCSSTGQDSVANLNDEFEKLNQPSLSPVHSVQSEETNGKVVDNDDSMVTINLRIPNWAYRLYNMGNYHVCIIPNEESHQFARAQVLENPEYWVVDRASKFKEPNPPMCSKTAFQPVEEPVEVKTENADHGVKSENFTPEPFNPALLNPSRSRFPSAPETLPETRYENNDAGVALASSISTSISTPSTSSEHSPAKPTGTEQVFGYYPRSSILEKCDQDIENMGYQDQGWLTNTVWDDMETLMDNSVNDQ